MTKFERVRSAATVMDAKNRERGILKLEPRPRISIDTKSELTPQVSYELAPPSPQPSVDRLSVTWADPSSMTSSGVNLFHLPSETPISNEVKFSPSAGDGSDDEDYSASLSAVLRQRRASVRRSRKGRTRRPSSPFMADENRARRRSSVFTTSSGDTAISIDEGQSAIVTQEQIFDNIYIHKEVLALVKQEPLGMRRKLKLVHQAKTYIKRHEGELQERLAQSKSTRDIYARFNILLAAKWQQLKREAANVSNLLIPWELRIKEIESHFGSVVASYFTFLRWLFWVNLVIAFILLVFVIVPEYLTANPEQDGERKIIMEEERRNATKLLTLWEFEGVLKCSPIFYGYYTNVERPEYRMPLAYFLTGLVVYIYSFVAILRKMAENSRMSKLSEKEDECIFSWKLFTGWDFMIGNAETAHNRIASVILGFKEALLEEAEKKKDLRNWRIISLRALVNICVVILLAVSAYAVVTVVTRSDNNPNKERSWWRENETTIVVTVISITFPVFFELLGFLEHYHPRKQLRLQLARIMLLNLLNLYSLIFALFSKIDGMSNELRSLKPTLDMNAMLITDNTLNITESLAMNIPSSCSEIRVPCSPCNIISYLPPKIVSDELITPEITTTSNSVSPYSKQVKNQTNDVFAQTSKAIKYETTKKDFSAENLIDREPNETEVETTTLNSILLVLKELEKLRNISQMYDDINDTSSEIYDNEYNFEDITNATEIIVDTTTSIENSEEIFSFNDTTGKETSLVSTTEESTLITEETWTDYDISVQSTFANKNITEIDSTNTANIETWIDTSSKGLTESTDNTMDTNTYYSRNITDSNTDADFTTSIYNKGTYVPKINEDATTIDVERYSTSTDEVFYDTTESSFEWTNIINFTDTTLPIDLSTMTSANAVTVCPDISFNCTVNCDGQNITQTFLMTNCTVIENKCYVKKCEFIDDNKNTTRKSTNATVTDIVYIDKYNRKVYNLTVNTRKKLLKLCWETMFGQELVKLTMMDLVFTILGTLFMDFFRALFVRYMNRCWCWDLEKKFPEYGDFKIAENILHLINNQGMVWMGMFFSPGLVVLNVFKLVIMMYLRSWAVMTCNVPHEVVFRVSKSNNFYLALLLTMLFLCVLPVGYAIVWERPSWHCGPFSEYERIYHILTNNIYKILPKSLNFALEYIASPAIVIPLLVLLILIIYYLTSLTNSLREANNDLKHQLRRERTEERRKMFQLADTRRRAGSTAMDSTPFARWKKALPSLPLNKSFDSDDRKTTPGDETQEPQKNVKKRSGIFAKIVGMALDKKSDVETVSEADHNASPSPNNVDDETDTDFHESLPKEVLKIKDITIIKNIARKKSSVEFKTDDIDKPKYKADITKLTIKLDKDDDLSEKEAMIQKQEQSIVKEKLCEHETKTPDLQEVTKDSPRKEKKLQRKQTSELSTQLRQSDSIGSVIPVITISTTESDDEILQSQKGEKVKSKEAKISKQFKSDVAIAERYEKIKRNTSDLKSLRRQSSVDSIKEHKSSKEKKPDEGHKYQYSL